MTPAAFLSLALSLPGAEPGAHQGGADLRVRGRIFASPADRPGADARGRSAYLKLTAEQQAMLCAAEPGVFSPVAGGWGLRGATWIDVSRADRATAASALWMAWRNAAPKSLQKLHPPA